ncbi:PAS domain S-box protein [Terrisporobacter sp.]|uniref:PAS domain S-box protein n=1 Tax=Terrisporobacter sp. TaxID=1965305 RepID=UPI00261C3416|nr:PAS domain S-box protein [Terrisporobacter sp.]
MEKILDIIDDYIIILNLDCNIQFCNKKLLSKLGYKIEELKNINIEKIFNDSVSLNIDLIKNNKDKNLKMDLELGCKSGEKLLIYGEFLLDDFKGKESIFIVGKDLCEKSYIREDLENILDNIQLNCWLKNIDGEYVYVNESYAKELKDDRLNILGKKTSDYWDEKMCNKFIEMDKEVIQSKKYQLTQSYSKQGDTDLWVETYKSPIFNKDNEVEYIFGSTKDITLQKKLENKININNISNILMKNNSKNGVRDLLNNLGENILNYFECDGTSVMLVNKEKSCLDVVVNCGKSNTYKDGEEILKIDLDKINDLDDIPYLNNINSVEEIEYEPLKKYMMINQIRNIGIYNITFNSETIGFLVLTCFDENTLRFNKFDYLKTICDNIGVMIKSHTLSKELQSEFEKRRKIEGELELFLDISVDLIARVGAKGDLKYINGYWTKVLGWTKEELLSMNIMDLIHDDYKEEYKIIIEEGKFDTGCIVNKLRCKDGSYKWIEINYKILRNEGTFVLTAKDLSEQRKQKKERKALEEAIQMETLKNEFFANISHEFRTPLNIILGTMQLMQRNIERSKITWDDSLNLESHINYIKQNSYRLLRLVNNLIDITCIDSGYLKLQSGNYNIVDIIESITLSVAQYIKDQGINLIFDTNCEELVIACDPDKIERIMLNLLSNAIKYTDKEGFIYVDLYADDENVKVSVKDNGTGISKDQLGIIFDRFKKIDNNLNRKCEGSGIGLSLVKSLVELQDGRIYVNSELGVGSEFTFELPITFIEEDSKMISERKVSESSQIEKCNIEFSDIYS